MLNIVHLLFEARKLKHIPRSGFHFLEAGKESVAEHSFMTAFIAFVMAQNHPGINVEKLTSMCLLHDLPEARIGDLNYLQKKYVTADEPAAIKDFGRDLPFAQKMEDLMTEFNQKETLEAKLAGDADQLSLLLDLKALLDLGLEPPKKWIPHVVDRLLTDTARSLSETILQTPSDAWWLEQFTD